MMSSATSTDAHGLRPWQFFVLAGMLGATATVVVAAGQPPASVITLSLTVLAASLVGFGLYRSILPLVMPEAASAPTLIAGRTRAALEREKSLVLRSIKELEFDRAMGKVAPSDFEEMSGRLRSRAIGLMHQLDEGGGYRDLIERELELRLGHKPEPIAAVRSGDVGPQSDASSEDGIDPAREAQDDGPAQWNVDSVTPAALVACASCGTANDADARFCKTCGTKFPGAV